MATVEIHVAGWREIGKALRAFTPEVEKSARRRLRQIASAAADDARARASWSKKIPPGVTFGVTQRGPYLRYRGSAPTIGRLEELRTTWRHPLFGNRAHWYTQRGRKFLQPAADAKVEAAAAEMEAAVEEAKRVVGL